MPRLGSQKQKKYRVVLSVTNDLVSDQRVNKVANSLIQSGFDVKGVGRKLSNSLPAPAGFKIKRFRLLFIKKAFFYAEYNIRLFFYLLFVKADIFLANDLDTLPANYAVARIRRKKLVYDSHEYFTEVPELVNRPGVRKVWERIERYILPKVEYAYTVCDSIAKIYKDKYGIEMKVVRNIPLRESITEDFLPESLKQIQNENIILYQGAVNMGRGLEEVIRAMAMTDNAKLLIVGDGDIRDRLERMVESSGLKDKIIFTGKVPFNKLYAYTKRATIGLSIEENMGLNYYYALPNKLFDYIRAEVPVLASRLPEIEKIVDSYGIGCFIDSHDPVHIAERIHYMLSDEERRHAWKSGLRRASEALNWEQEEKVLIALFEKIVSS